MDKSSDLQAFFSENTHFVSTRLSDWYQLNKRVLPWRDIDDPYKIWVSEIILQQTRVDQGLNYYLRFIERFPDVRSLALAEEQEVLKYWQGLGYYSRARNLYAASQMVMDKFEGVFPTEYSDVIQLKGVGEYTAAAIVSFAWNKPYPVVDGNVFRFISRLLAIDEPIDTGKGKKRFTEIAGTLMNRLSPGLFNQAIMEFGALQCVPVSPDCRICPFEEKCMALMFDKVQDYPIKQNKIKTQERYLYYFHIKHGGYTFLKKRHEKGIWQNLYEFPVIESEKQLSFEEISTLTSFKQLFPEQNTAAFSLIVNKRKHILSHRILYANFYEIIPEKMLDMETDLLKVKEEEVSEYPIHRLMQFYLER